MTESAALGRRLVEQTTMRRAIARRMSDSKREAPHLYVSNTFEVDAALAVLAQANESRGADSRISFTSLLVHACALALRRHPELNAIWTEDGLAHVDAINVAVAIAIDGGLVAPAVLDCGRLDLEKTGVAVADLVHRARAGNLRGRELTEGTFTLSNLGMFPVSHFAAIVTPPQVAILAVGAVERLPRFHGDEILERNVLTATVSADHRAVDGIDVARFFATLKSVLDRQQLR